MSAAPLVSVILATASAPPTLDEQLRALAQQVDAPPFEVVLVGNRAGDAAEAAVERWSSRLPIRLVRADEKAGVAYARNAGVADSTGERLLFLDDDDIVSPNYVAAMAQALAVHPAVGAAIELELLNPGWRAQTRFVPQVWGLGEGASPFAYGATLGARRDVFDRVGPFEEALDVPAGEDVDWCHRLARAGFVLGYVPDAVVHYRLRTRYRDLWRQGRRYGRASEITNPSWAGWRRWVRSLTGPLRLVVLGPGKGARRRGVFLLGRRIGQAGGRNWKRPG